MVNISTVILTKNEEENIFDCIKSIKFCDEIIVVDDYSEDKTVKIAKELNAKVSQRVLNGDFAAQRNFGIKKAKGKWILFLDADERVTPYLKNEIIQLTNDPLIEYSGFYIKRVDLLWGKKVAKGEAGSIKLLRLAKKNSGVWSRMVHEFWRIRGKKKTLINPILHYPHQSLQEFIESINSFSKLHAYANREEGKRSNLFKIILWPKGHFIKNWVFKMGFFDETLGFIIAILMSFHSFLSWSKLWFLQKQQSTRV